MLVKYKTKKTVFSRLLMLTPLLIGVVAFQTKEPNLSSIQPGDFEGYSNYVTLPIDTGEVLKSAQVKPVPPNGMTGFLTYVGTNYKFPREAIDAKVHGKIVLTFVVERDGSVSHIKIVNDLGHGTGEEAVRVLAGSDKWEPGYEEGKPVRVLYTLPIVLSLPKVVQPADSTGNQN